MRNCRQFWLLFIIGWGIQGCSSGGGAAPPVVVTPPPPAGVALTGAVVDGPVAGATVSAYALNAAGVPGTTPLATATTSASGAYSLMLPSGTKGPVLITSVGGTFVDDASKKTVNAPALSALIPDVSGTAVTAQLTPITTLAAQVALATSSTQNPVGTVALALNSAIGAALGGQSDILTTPLVDISTAGCASTADQASVDASLILAGISQLAATYHVTTPDLIQALVVDVQSDNVFDGEANGVPLTVPLAGGVVQLCAIEGNCAGAAPTGLARQLGGAIGAFQKSSANTCAVTESSTQQQTLANAPALTPAFSKSFRYTYTLNATLSGFSGSAGVTADMLIGLTCKDDGGGTNTGSPFQGVKSLGGSGSFTVLAGANGETSEDGYTVGINAANDCGTNTWTLNLVVPSDLTCKVTGATSGKFTSSDGGDTNVAVSPPTVSCSPLFTIGGTVSGLTTGPLTLEDNGGDALIVPQNAAIFTFGTSLASGATYAVTVAAQPAGLDCKVSPSTAQTVASSNVTSVAVTCSPITTGGAPGAIDAPVYVVDSSYKLFEFSATGALLAYVKLPGTPSSVSNLNGGGIALDSNNVYVTLGQPTSTVAAFDKTTLQPVTLAQGAFGNLGVPRGIVFDSADSEFFVADGSDVVVAFDAAGAAVSAFDTTVGMYGPSGIAYDSVDHALWIANYTGGTASATPNYGISEFNPDTTMLIANFPTAATAAPAPFAPPANTGHELPYGVTYCKNTVTVGFISDGTNAGKSEAAGYTTAGTLASAPFGGTITNLHNMACMTNGNVLIAADNGLLEYSSATGASLALPAGGFAGLTPPIYGVGIGAAAGLNAPEGLVYIHGSLYVANSANNQILVYTVQTSTSTGAVTAMTLSTTITADLNDPVRLALDANGILFVANLGNNSITAYDTTHANAEITNAFGAPLISASIKGPLGIAVDSEDNIYVSNNGGNSIAMYQPVTPSNLSNGYTEPSFSPISADSAGNPFTAPGALADIDIQGQNYLLVGTGSVTSPDHLYLYKAPFTAIPAPVYDLSSAQCATMPTGPTGIAAYVSQSDYLNSEIFVSSYFNNDAVEYLASQLIDTTSTCPTPIVTSSLAQIAGPEGIAVDSSGNNVFIANAGANTITVYTAGTSFTHAPIFTLSN